MIADIVTNNINTLILLGAAAGYSVKTYLEMTGRTKSSKLLREENRDLRERNGSLEAQKQEFQLQVAEGKANELALIARIEALELKVRELESRDQAAVLHALADHEVRAQARADHQESQAAERHSEHVGYLDRIVVALEKTG